MTAKTSINLTINSGLEASESQFFFLVKNRNLKYLDSLGYHKQNLTPYPKPSQII